MLQKRVSAIHAQAILETIRCQACPTEQKLALIQAVQTRLKAAGEKSV